MAAVFAESGMPLGLFKKVGKYPGTRGLVNQNCPESAWSLHIQYSTGKEKKKKKKGGGKVGRSEKVGIPTKVGKTASLLNAIFLLLFLHVKLMMNEGRYKAMQEECYANVAC